MKVPKFYHKKKRESKSTIILRHSLCYAALFFFIAMSAALLIKNDVKIPQKEVVLKVDVQEQIKLCLPDEEK